jgi:hypothetical protein
MNDLYNVIKGTVQWIMVWTKHKIIVLDIKNDYRLWFKDIKTQSRQKEV